MKKTSKNTDITKKSIAVPEQKAKVIVDLQDNIREYLTKTITQFVTGDEIEKQIKHLAKALYKDGYKLPAKPKGTVKTKTGGQSVKAAAVGGNIGTAKGGGEAPADITELTKLMDKDKSATINTVQSKIATPPKSLKPAKKGLKK